MSGQPLITNDQLTGPIVSSIDISGGTTGLTTTGGPITSTGAIQLTGTLNTTHGGTGLAVIGSTLQVLRTNAGATALEWATPTLNELTGILNVTKGGTGLSGLGSALQVLRTNAGATALEWSTPTTANLSGLTDVTITTPTINQVLQYNGTNWINAGAAALTVHNTLSGLQGGTTGQYFHSTTDQNTTLAALTTASNGLFVKTGLGIFTPRAITGTASQINVGDGTGLAANPTIAIANDAILPGTAAITVPIGTTAQRPVVGTNGNIRFNTTTLMLEGFQTSWKNIIPTTDYISGNTAPFTSIVEGTTVFVTVAAVAFSLPIGLTSSQFHLIDLGGNTGTKTFTLYKITGGVSTSIGTIDYTTPYITPTITFTSLTSFAIGDALSIVGTTAGQGPLSGIWSFTLTTTI
jgi:hypothetical protein